MSEEFLEDETAVRAYKNLKNAERAFRCIKTVDLDIRPIYHRLEARVRAHVFIRVLAYYVEWHMRRAWAPLMFSEDDLRRAESLRNSEVGPAVKSESAKCKAGTKKTADGMTVHGLRRSDKADGHACARHQGGGRRVVPRSGSSHRTAGQGVGTSRGQKPAVVRKRKLEPLDISMITTCSLPFTSRTSA